MKAYRFLPLVVAALLATATACELSLDPEPADRSPEDACLDEGYDEGTQAYQDCIDTQSVGED